MLSNKVIRGTSQRNRTIRGNCAFDNRAVAATRLDDSDIGIGTESPRNEGCCVLGSASIRDCNIIVSSNAIADQRNRVANIGIKRNIFARKNTQSICSDRSASGIDIGISYDIDDASSNCVIDVHFIAAQLKYGSVVQRQ